MTRTDLRDTLAGGPGTFLGRSGRWEYRVCKSSSSGHYAYGTRVVDGLSLESYTLMGPRTALRILRRLLRRMERIERRMP